MAGVCAGACLQQLFSSGSDIARLAHLDVANMTVSSPLHRPDTLEAIFPGSTVSVQVFAEEGKAPQIPGPLFRATSGMTVRISVRNAIADSTLVVHGLRAGTGNDTLQVAPGATREITFSAGLPGTYHYWATTTKSLLAGRTWRDSQLSGAVVVDSIGARVDSSERIFVITALDVFPDDTVHNQAKEDIWELAINGMSWPHTERLEYPVGDSVHWRWINASYLPHPMHLRGFHFRVTSKGNGVRDTAYPAANTRLAVTELMMPGSSYGMSWMPTRAGTWLMHCHMVPHIVPFPERDSTSHHADMQDVTRYAANAMAGLVLGVTTVDNAGRAALAAPSRSVRLLAQRETGLPKQRVRHGFVMQRDAEPRPDSVEVPGTPLILVRDETTEITVVNRLPEPTSVHWHGMELQSVYDGVVGWSRTGSSVAPLVAPGDSFKVVITPPRAGTYIYHTHMDEGRQLSSGMFGALLVLKPGTTYDATTDRVFIVGNSIVRDSSRITVNGATTLPAISLKVGTSYRFRFINIMQAEGVNIHLLTDTTHHRWRQVAKDGADLPPSLQTVRPAKLGYFGAGETHDVEFTPTTAGSATLRFRILGLVIDQAVRIR